MRSHIGLLGGSSIEWDDELRVWPRQDGLFRPPATDEDPWLPADPELDHRGPSFLDGAVVATGWWVYTTGAVVAALAVVLVAIGIRRAVR